MSFTASKFASAMNASASTWNGALSYASPDVSGQTTGRISLFFKGVRGLNIPRLYEYLRACSQEDLTDTFLLAFQLRDCRGGKGERELGRKALTWLFVNFPQETKKVISIIPDFGRWDDLLEFFPGALELKSLDHVRASFSSPHLTEETLAQLRDLQGDVVNLIATRLKEDLAVMQQGKSCSLCAKWTPSEGDSFDRKTHAFRTIASALGVSCRSLRKIYNTPLRAYINVVERFMCSGQWDHIDFNKVPSCAMKRLKKAFAKHDSERFNEWKNALKLGDPKVAKVNAKQLYPHELVSEVRSKNTVDQVTEAQWNVLVEEVKKLGSLKDCIAVVDTSGSMFSPLTKGSTAQAIDVSVSLGMLISQVNEGAFHGHLITFESKPSFAVIPDSDLMTRFRAVTAMSWGGSTNIEATFKLILDRGKQCKLSQEDMPKRLVIISDQQFDSCGGGKTNMERINEMYAQSNYTRPQIVFWNVVGSTSDFPVTVDEEGTAMIAGFSPSILKSLIEGKKFSSIEIMRTTLDDERYDPVRLALGVARETVEVDPVPPAPTPADEEFEVVDE